MLAGKFSADVFDLAIKYGLCSELLRWQARPVMFAQEVRARVKSAADLLSDVFKDKSLHTSLNLVSKVFPSWRVFLMPINLTVLEK